MSTFERRCLWALPAGGIITLIAFLPWVSDIGHPAAQYDPPAFARLITSPVGPVTFYGYLIGALCVIFGVLALYLYLSSTPAHNWAAAGMILGITGTVSLIAMAFALLSASVVADFYLSGHEDAAALLGNFEGGSAVSARLISLVLVTLVVGLTGGVAMAVAIWRSGRLPKWLGIPLVAGFVLPLSGPIGMAVLIFAGAWIAYRAYDA